MIRITRRVAWGFRLAFMFGVGWHALVTIWLLQRWLGEPSNSKWLLFVPIELLALAYSLSCYRDTRRWLREHP